MEAMSSKSQMDIFSIHDLNDSLASVVNIVSSAKSQAQVTSFPLLRKQILSLNSAHAVRLSLFMFVCIVHFIDNLYHQKS